MINVDITFSACISFKQLNANLSKALKNYNISKYAYTYYGDDFHMGEHLAYQHASTNLKNWHQHFHECGYEEYDTIGKRVRKSILPQLWNLEHELAFVDGRQAKFYEDAIAHGLNEGISTPIHGPDNQFSILVTHTDNNNELLENYPDVLDRINIIGLHYHNRVAELLINSIQKKKNEIFSSRELQCLALTAKGMSASSVAQHLNIKKRTVDFHLANVNKKVGCKNKYEALQNPKVKRILENLSLMTVDKV